MAHPEILHGPLFLPEPGYDMWVAGELEEALGVPNDGTHVEIIGGEIVVSPMPNIEHALIANEIHKLFIVAQLTRAAFSWEMLPGVGLNLTTLRDGYIPDLLCIEAETLTRLRAKKSAFTLLEHVKLAVEVTSPSNAADDREPGPRRKRPTKWAGYASVGVPFYLLIDRDPKKVKATLYSDPDTAEGTYRSSKTWSFGEVIELPEPFGIEIPTTSWQDWSN
jgi:Uma2 family endonuclease